MSNQASRSRNKKVAPAPLQKQLQAVIAVNCLTWVHTLDQMKPIQVQKKLFEHYLGNTVSKTVTTVQDCLQGDYVFAMVFGTSSSLTLKNCLWKREETIFTRAHHSLLTAFNVPIKVPPF
jgi:hypothetical protein